MPRDTAWRRFYNGRWYRVWRESGSRKLHQQLEHRWLWEQANGPIPEGYEIHHINHDQTDNRLDNFQLVTQEWHDNYHQRLRENHRIVNGVEQRRCARCDEYKPLDQFSIRRAGTYHGYCKPCAVEQVREWRHANAERVRERKREYYASTESERRKAKREYVRGPYKPRQ